MGGSGLDSGIGPLQRLPLVITPRPVRVGGPDIFKPFRVIWFFLFISGRVIKTDKSKSRLRRIVFNIFSWFLVIGYWFLVSICF